MASHPNRRSYTRPREDPFEGVIVLFFDLMGTCLDWHSSVVDALPGNEYLCTSTTRLGGSDMTINLEGRGLPQTPQSEFALRWRKGFFDEIHAKFERGEPEEDIDVTHRRVLDRLLDQLQDRCGPPSYKRNSLTSPLPWTEEQKQRAVSSWHSMLAWADVLPTLRRLRTKYEIYVLANGTTSLQLDLIRSSGLAFDMLFSSELLGYRKPDRRMYERAVELVGGGNLQTEQCVMVAAHAYDLRAAREVGMKTVYVWRSTEDVGEDMGRVRGENDWWIGKGGGLAVFADIVGL